MTRQPGRTARRLSLATTLLGAVLLLSCQQDGLLGASGGAQSVAIAPRISVAPADSTFFNLTAQVRATLQAGTRNDTAWIDFDVGEHVFPGVPVNTAYTLTFEGFLADSTTPVWTATTTGTAGTTTTVATLTPSMAPTPLLVQNGHVLEGGAFESAQIFEILTRGIDSVRVSYDGVGWSLYAGPVTIGASKTLHVQVWRGKQIVATRSIEFVIKTTAVAEAPTPAIAPNQGTVYGTQAIAITATGADRIEYSWDKQTWIRYAPPLALDNHPMIFARSILDQDTSDTSEARFTLKAPKPVLQPDSGTFTDSVAVFIQAPGADTIEFSLGNDVWNRRLGDTATAIVRASGTVRAISRKQGMENDTADGVFTIRPPKPLLTASDTLQDQGTVDISARNADSVLYLLDGEWKKLSSLDGTVSIGRTSTLKVRAYLAKTPSEDTVRTFTVIPSRPSFDPSGGTYGRDIQVMITASGADSIEYSRDNVSWTPVPGPEYLVAIWKTTTLRARTFRAGTRSELVSADYLIDTAVTPRVKMPLEAYGTRWDVSFHSPGADSIQIWLPPFQDTTQWRALPTSIGGPVGRDSGVWHFPDTGTVRVRAFKHGISSRVFTYKFPYSTFGIPWKKFGFAQPGRWGTLRDPRDGRVYTTININGRAWMAQNLAYDGGGTKGACHADSPDSCEKYGRLYSWSEALGLESRFDAESYRGMAPFIAGLCPAGWRIPTRADFDTLMMERLLGSGQAPMMLKSLAGWSGGRNGIDSLGFRLLPAGALSSQRWVDIAAGSGTLLWSTDQTTATQARVFSVLGGDSETLWPDTDVAFHIKKDLRSVRCIEMPQ